MEGKAVAVDAVQPQVAQGSDPWSLPLAPNRLTRLHTRPHHLMWPRPHLLRYQWKPPLLPQHRHDPSLPHGSVPRFSSCFTRRLRA